MSLGQRAKDRKVSQACSSLSNPALEVVGARVALGPDSLERLHLQVEHPRAIDHAVAIERATGGRQPLQIGAEIGGARCFFDAEIEWIYEATTRRVIRARFLTA